MGSTACRSHVSIPGWSLPSPFGDSKAWGLLQRCKNTPKCGGRAVCGGAGTVGFQAHRLRPGRRHAVLGASWRVNAPTGSSRRKKDARNMAAPATTNHRGRCASGTDSAARDGNCDRASVSQPDAGAAPRLASADGGCDRDVTRGESAAENHQVQGEINDMAHGLAPVTLTADHCGNARRLAVTTVTNSAIGPNDRVDAPARAPGARIEAVCRC